MSRTSLAFLLALGVCFCLQAQTIQIAKKSTKSKTANELDALKLPDRYKTLPVMEDLPNRIKKLVLIYMRKGNPYLAEDEDIRREEEYLLHYKDKTYVKYMLVKELRTNISRDVQTLEATTRKGRNPEDIAESEESLQILRNRLSIAEKWKP